MARSFIEVSQQPGFPQFLFAKLPLPTIENLNAKPLD